MQTAMIFFYIHNVSASKTKKKRILEGSYLVLVRVHLNRLRLPLSLYPYVHFE